MDGGAWKPSDVLAVATLIGQLIFGLVLAVGIFSTKKQVDGRMSQLIDLAARFGGAPDLRSSTRRVLPERRIIRPRLVSDRLVKGGGKRRRRRAGR